MNESTGIQRALDLDEVPAEKWDGMLRRTLIGLIFVGLGILGALRLGWDWKVTVGLVGFGCTVWSTQVVVRTLVALVQPIKAIRRAIKGG